MRDLLSTWMIIVYVAVMKLFPFAWEDDPDLCSDEDVERLLGEVHGA